MAASKSTIPHFYVATTVDMSCVLAGCATSGVGLTASIAHGVVASLKRSPSLNGTWEDDVPHRAPAVHLSLAVATDQGVLTPTIVDAGTLSLSQLGEAVRQAVERARRGRLRASDVVMGTFTLSNVGMYGVEEAISIIVPPQVGILCAGAIEHAPVVRGGAVVSRPLMKVALSADHRAVDGAEACAFVRMLKATLECSSRDRLPEEGMATGGVG